MKAKASIVGRVSQVGWAGFFAHRLHYRVVPRGQNGVAHTTRLKSNMKLFENGAHNFLFAFAFIGIFFCIYITAKMFLLDWDIKIIQHDLVCVEPLHNRCSMKIVTQDRDYVLNKISVFILLFDSDTLSVGNTIEKKGFSFSYKVNGEQRFWKHWTTIFKILLLSFIFLKLWLSERIRRIFKFIS
jgi:hypothetical protein